jgi:hypothetical protein
MVPVPAALSASTGPCLLLLAVTVALFRLRRMSVVGVLAAACATQSPTPSTAPAAPTPPVPAPTLTPRNAPSSTMPPSAPTAASTPDPPDAGVSAPPPSVPEPEPAPVSCVARSGAPLDLTRALAASDCQVDLRGASAKLPATVAIRVEPESKSVRSGKRLRLRVTFTNSGSETAVLLVSFLPRVFGTIGDSAVTTPGFDVSAYDRKGRNVDFPRDIGLLGMLNPPRTDGAQIELPPKTRAEAHVVWEAVGYDPNKDYGQKMSGMGRLPDPEPLAPGKYRLQIDVPVLGARNASVEISVKR